MPAHCLPCVRRKRMDRSTSGVYRGALRSFTGSSAGLREQRSHMTSPAHAVILDSDDDSAGSDGAHSSYEVLQEVAAEVADAIDVRQESSEAMFPSASRVESSEQVGSCQSGQSGGLLRPPFSRHCSAPWLTLLPTSSALTVAPFVRPAPRPCQPVPHILVIGCPQSGKSTFINAYRAAVCHGTDWPLAPTGMCGLHGTTRIEGYPNSIQRTQWILVDTPGRVFDTTSQNNTDEDLLRAMIHGLPWKTHLVNPVLDNLPAAPQHHCHHCFIVVHAHDFIDDMGPWALLKWQSRYVCGTNVGRALFLLQHLVASVRLAMNDTPPYVVVTHMDQFGGADCAAARSALLQVTSRCISPQRTFFVGCPQPSAELLHAELRSSMSQDVQGSKELRRLHQDLLRSLQWSVEQDDQDA
jgi:hypothetical protein